MGGILDIGVSALLSFQHSLNTTGHNIANSDTEGYSRQRTLLATHTPQLRGVGWIGSGVKVVGVERLSDQFIATQVRSAQSVSSQLQTFAEHAERLDNVLADPNIGLDPAIQNFFDALQVMADDPASTASRQVVLSEAGSLVSRFHDLDRQFSDARVQLNQEMESLTDEINSLAQSIGRVNQNIVEAIGAAGGADPNDLLDQRDVLLGELSKRVDITIVPQDDGAWNVFIGKGQALVMGSNVATLGTQPDPADVSQHNILFTDSVGSRVVTDQLSGGEIGGLLDFRDQILDPAQNQLGLVAIGVSDRLNSQQQLGLDLDGNLGIAIFSTPSITPFPHSDNVSAVAVSAAVVDSGNLTASDYRLESDGGDLYTLTRLNDGQTFAINTGGAYPYTSTEIDGMTIGITGAATQGDRFYIQPTRTGASQITLKIDNPRFLAAAGPVRINSALNADTGNPNTGSGALTQPTVTTTANLPLAAPITLEWRADVNNDGTADDPGFRITGGPGGTIAYDPATDNTGRSYTFAAYGNMSFTVSGVPAEGDRYLIEHNGSGQGDNRNALAMAAIQQQNTLLGDTSGVAETATLQETYGQMVSDIGSKTRQAKVNSEASNGLLERHQTTLSSVAGVNLDEEAANLIRFQQAYQASAQVIAVANTLFDTLIGAVRR
ncbi:MAG: flagellar hook-associated protein FlgK [Gammaproteobacteria bacterium]|nr:flagellar hook-associated protein FlgK [Gammaproteobacteria bacterium]